MPLIRQRPPGDFQAELPCIAQHPKIASRRAWGVKQEALIITLAIAQVKHIPERQLEGIEDHATDFDAKLAQGPLVVTSRFQGVEGPPVEPLVTRCQGTQSQPRIDHFTHQLRARAVKVHGLQRFPVTQTDIQLIDHGLDKARCQLYGQLAVDDLRLQFAAVITTGNYPLHQRHLALTTQHFTHDIQHMPDPHPQSPDINVKPHGLRQVIGYLLSGIVLRTGHALQVFIDPLLAHGNSSFA
ncbi:hypothetical protein D3C80_834810 [compost metagenome]